MSVEIVIDLPKERLAADIEAAKVVLMVLIVSASNASNDCTFVITFAWFACTSVGNAATAAVITTRPLPNVCHRASFNSAILLLCSAEMA
jgi:hypothetical protein